MTAKTSRYSSPRTIRAPEKWKLATRSILTAALCTTFVACTGDNDNSVPTSNDATVAPLTEDTNQIIRNAAAGIANPLQKNYASASEMVSAMTDTPAVNQVLKKNIKKITQRSIAAHADTSDPDIEQLLMMFVDPSTGASTSRNGNVITINPDSNTICDELIPDPSDQQDKDLCMNFVQDFDVVITATSDDAGVTALQYNQQPVVTMDYTPDSSSIEVRLDGIHSVLTQLVILENDGGTVPDVMRGVIKLTSNIDGSSDTGELVSGSLAVTEAVEIIDSTENISLSLQPSTLLALQSAPTAANIQLGIEGLSYTEELENSDGTNTAQATLSLPAFSANIEIRDDESLTVTKLGFGKGPFRVTLNDSDLINIALQQFGFTADNSSSQITLIDALDFSLSLNNAGGYLDDELPDAFNANFSASAGKGSTLQGQQNESVKVTTGGPVTIDYMFNDGDTNPTGSMTANAGECFDLNDDDETDVDLFAIVNCN